MGARCLVVFEQIPETTHFFIVEQDDKIEIAKKYNQRFLNETEDLSIVETIGKFWTEENINEFVAFQDWLFENCADEALPIIGPIYVVFHMGILL